MPRLYVHSAECLSSVARDGEHRYTRFAVMTHVALLQGWKGNVKAKHFVMSLREYFAERYDYSMYGQNIYMDQEASNAAGVDGETQNSSLPPIKLEDQWALQYINITRIRPLLEALDEDSSAFITVKEVNVFTSSRPQGWRQVPICDPTTSWL